MITATVSEEVSQHVFLAKSYFKALKALKYLHDSHFEMEIIQLMLKLFSLEVKDNDHMLIAYKIKSIKHKIQASSMKHDLSLASFVKLIYPTHSNYLESLQEIDKFKYLTFDTLVEKITDRENSFGKKSSEPTGESLCFVQKEKNQPKDPFKGDSNKRGRGRRNFRGKGGKNNSSKRSDLKCKRCGKNGHEAD